MGLFPVGHGSELRVTSSQHALRARWTIKGAIQARHFFRTGIVLYARHQLRPEPPRLAELPVRHVAEYEEGRPPRRKDLQVVPLVLEEIRELEIDRRRVRDGVGA